MTFLSIAQGVSEILLQQMCEQTWGGINDDRWWTLYTAVIPSRITLMNSCCFRDANLNTILKLNVEYEFTFDHLKSNLFKKWNIKICYKDLWQHTVNHFVFQTASEQHDGWVNDSSYDFFKMLKWLKCGFSDLTTFSS